MKPYRTRLFFICVFTGTWVCWGLAPLCPQETGMTLMLGGLIFPAVLTWFFVRFSGSRALRRDYQRKITLPPRLYAGNLAMAVILFAGALVLAILISLFAGGSLDQLKYSGGFSFSGAGTSALVTILLASVIEELAWRGYAEDSLAQGMSWFSESLLFGALWSLWHLPLILIPGTYHNSLLQMGWAYVLNFHISVIPLGFLMTWVYVKGGRWYLPCIVFHLCINMLQELVNISPETKMIQTGLLCLTAAGVVLKNRELFFNRDHIGKMPLTE